MTRLYEIGASNLHGTYNAGRFVAETPEEAIEQARERYRLSGLGRALKDVAAFRFYVKGSERVDGRRP